MIVHPAGARSIGAWVAVAALACEPTGRTTATSSAAASIATAPPAPTATAPPTVPAPAPTTTSSAEPLSDEASDPKKGWPAGYAPPLVRETVEVDVGPGKETWILRWKKPPEPACFTAEAKALARCLGLQGPGESGELELARTRGGQELEVMELTDVLSSDRRAILARYEGDVRFSAKALSEARLVKLVTLEDVNQDGRVAEFRLVGRYQPWKGRASVLAGFSPTTGKGFAFVAENAGVWERVRTLPRFEFVKVPCFDHASPTEYVDVFVKGDAGVTRTGKRFHCLEAIAVDGGSARGKLEGAEEPTPLGL